MSARKPNSNSVLKTLPSDRQAAIAEHCRTNSLEDTRAWLAQDGIKTSEAALSSWLSWWQLQQRFNRAQDNAEEFKTWLAKAFPEMSEEEFDRRASLSFQFEAMREGDADTYLAFATARQKGKMDQLKFEQKEREIELAQRRVVLLEQKAQQAEQAEAAVKDTTLTPEQQQARLKEIFGIPT